MIIGIDARFYGTEHTGLGRYTTNVLSYLPKYLEGHTLKIFLRKKYFETLTFPSNCEKILADFSHYSLQEQLLLPELLEKENCDLLYSLHFNVPLFLSCPFVVTIHDIIKTHFDKSDTTTRGMFVFALKRMGYDLIIKHAVNDSGMIIVPTNTVKNDILSAYPTDPGKIIPISEAPDQNFRRQVVALPDIGVTKGQYLLYVGNAYPHKNLSLLFDLLAKDSSLNLVIVSEQSSFLTKLLSVLSSQVLRRITVISNASDDELLAIYAGAKCLVSPSLMEGYGLPGIESLMIGVPVLASDIPVFREVYGDYATYFDPHSVESLFTAVKKLKKNKPFKFTRTWDDAAAEIAGVINESCHSLR